MFLTLPRMLARFFHNLRVPPKTLASLRRFSDLAAGTWPLNHEQERSWRRFVINASREDAAFDIDELDASVLRVEQPFYEELHAHRITP